MLMLHRSPEFAEIANPRIENGLGKERAICFGSFRLLPAQRLLLECGKPLRLGSRALELLIVLVERHGELVSKEELMARVWPNTFVEAANLTVHVAALRRTLGDGRDGNRFLINIPGRGYRFVAPVKITEDEALSPLRSGEVKPTHNLPASVNRLIGRDDIVTGLVAQLSRDRCLTIVGPGGIGKTSVAVAAAQEMIANYAHGVWLIDFAAISDPLLVPTALATVLELEIGAEDPLRELIATFRNKQMLFVLDNCEHVVVAAADLAAGILRGAPSVQILATSREPLRTDGERVHRLPPLQSPPVATGISADKALRFPAVQMFVERAAAALGEFVLSDEDAPIVANICRRLDGIPLAIEFAAARVNCFGIGGLAARLDDRLRLLTGGARTALPRQQTMRATLDWSYDLLTEAQQMVLRRIAVFSGDFTLRAADFVISDDPGLCNHIVDHVAELVTKSLVVAEMGDAEPRLRLLETTRAYALAKLIESGEFDAIAPRYAEYIRDSVQAAAQSNERAITRKPDLRRKSTSSVRRPRISKLQRVSARDQALPS
jgi:predicted ATPase/DNA-binding winged helix-turn-helix (wHTH) protein